MSRKIVKYSIAIGAVLAVSVPLLGADAPAFVRWYLTLLIMGIGFFPVAAVLFDSFEDCGWLFSRTLAIAVCGYAAWLFVTSGLQQFTSRRCIVITLILFGLVWVWFLSRPRKLKPSADLMLQEELMFLIVMLVWTYLFAFRPEASGTEKFMDYGLMASMERSTSLPAKDMWYGLAPVNYYYGGQYYAVYLSKFCYLPVRLTYNLMRAAVASFTFTLPFSIVWHLVLSRLRDQDHVRRWSMAGGLLAGTAVSLAGNVHYVLYGLFGSLLKLQGYQSYWFPSSTRYIGHNPETADQCIHEFPSYSFVLGDLHAHMINLIFVLTIVGLLYAWVRHVRVQEIDRLEQKRIREEQQLRRPTRFISTNSFKLFLKNNWAEGRLLMAGALIGLCKWTNYWDYIIYLTVAVFVIVMVSLFRYQDDISRVTGSVVLHAAEIWILTLFVPLPFMISFKPTVSGVGIAQVHSRLYQLAVLWGLPVVTAVFLLVLTLHQYHRKLAELPEKERPGSRILGFFRFVPQPDRFTLVLALCAFGLILIPELVYVRDIYENGFSRANTMFKLTYQAYVLFGIVMSYTLIRALVLGRRVWTRIISLALLCVLALTVGYLPYSVKEWFGNVFARSRYQGLDATAFMFDKYRDDAGAIDWLRTYVSGQPIVLEATGSSYSEYCRVSALTGLPTLEGWYVHEWLWRGNVDDLNEKDEHIRRIYEAESPQEAKGLLRDYGVSYLFVGSCEHRKYQIDDAVLQQLGEIMYQEGRTYVIRLDEAEE